MPSTEGNEGNEEAEPRGSLRLKEPGRAIWYRGPSAVKTHHAEQAAHALVLAHETPLRAASAAPRLPVLPERPDLAGWQRLG